MLNRLSFVFLKERFINGIFCVVVLIWFMLSNAHIKVKSHQSNTSKYLGRLLNLNIRGSDKN